MAGLARWGALPLLAVPMAAWALGLGDIELESALNQPLRADIQLVAATPDELDALRVGLAPADTFARYGIDRPGFLSGLTFNVTRDEQGHDVIRVSSRDAITEPFVTMLVEATWARGRLLREYTVLLDPPVLLPAPAAPAAAARPAEAGPTASRSTPSAPIERVPPPPAPQPAPAPRPAPAARPPAALPTASASATPPGSYGPVRRGETLWGIASSMRPSGITMNQIMLAIYRANPGAFDANMNLLHRGAILRIPPVGDMTSMTATAATSEAQRQIDAWQSKAEQQARLRLVPANETPATANPAPGAGAGSAASSGAAAENQRLEAQVSSLNDQLEESHRLLSLRDDQLRELQNQLAASNSAATNTAGTDTTEPAAAANAEPGVDLESEPVFVDETQQSSEAAPAEAGAGAEAPGAETPEAGGTTATGPDAESTAESGAAEPASTEAAPAAQPPAATNPPAPSVNATNRVVTTTPSGPGLVERVLGWIQPVLGWIMNPLLVIGLGVVAVLGAAAWYLRRRAAEGEDVTGRWEALEAEVDLDEASRTSTERLRRQVPEDTGVVVVEQPARQTEPQRKERPAEVSPEAEMPESAAEPTISSQTIIDLDQGDVLAEADFHMAYGLYDQAAELISKALEAEPRRRDLKLKLLEVFFVWGNKESFLDAAKALRAEIGSGPDPDWDKVIIMGKQICPDEPIFAEATASAGAVDVDLEAGEAALDFDLESREEPGLDMDFGAFSEPGAAEAGRQEPTSEELALESNDETGDDFNLLDIGSRTAAGLQSVFGEEEDPNALTTPDAVADGLAETQESPTIETPRDDDELTFDVGDLGQNAPTVEALGPNSPTIEGIGPNSPTIEELGGNAPTVEQPRFGGEGTSELPTIEQPKLAERPGEEQTAEIDLDDLGLEVDDLAALTGVEEALVDDGSLRSDDDTEDGLSASRISRVLEDGDELQGTGTEVLSDQDATMLAPGFDEDTISGTAVLEQEVEDETDITGTQRFKAPGGEDDELDLNLEDLSAALDGAETVEQPGGNGGFTEVFSNEGGTPLDLDVGLSVEGSEDPTGTEEFNTLDPQTLTEVGTKLDLARAYIDMGDPEGARSILEEVIDEGDAGQKREAQNLIQTLST